MHIEAYNTKHESSDQNNITLQSIAELTITNSESNGEYNVEDTLKTTHSTFNNFRDRLGEIDPQSDYTLIMTQAYSCFESNGELILSSNLVNTDHQSTVDQLDNHRNITMVGSTTFGRKNGQSTFTVFSYADFPSSSSTQPYSPRDSSTECDEESMVTTGHLAFKYDRDLNKYVSYKQPLGVSDVSRVNAIIQGKDQDVLKIAHNLGEFDRTIAPYLEQQIASHPHNAVGYHHRVKSPPHDPNVYTEYQALTNNWKKYFDEYGGNCILFSMDTIDMLEKNGIDSHGITYPLSSGSNQQVDGHSGVLAKVNDLHYLIDTGLSIPFPIPINSQIPIAPFYVTNERQFLVTTEREEIKPEILLLANQKLRRYPVTDLIHGKNFQSRIPDILTRLHNSRSVAKIDFHDADGSSKAFFSLSKGKLHISRKGFTKTEYTIDDFITGNVDGEIVKICEDLGIDSEFVITQLKSFTDHKNT